MALGEKIVTAPQDDLAAVDSRLRRTQ